MAALKAKKLLRLPLQCVEKADSPKIIHKKFLVKGQSPCRTLRRTAPRKNSTFVHVLADFSTACIKSIYAFYSYYSMERLGLDL